MLCHYTFLEAATRSRLPITRLTLCRVLTRCKAPCHPRSAYIVQSNSLITSSISTGKRTVMSQSSPPTRQPHYILCFYVPRESTATVTTEVCKSGAGSYPGGLYTGAFWVTSGTGQFRSMEGANPTLGQVGQVEKVEEDKVEVLCVGKDCAEQAVAALLKAHPYEQAAYYVVKTEDM